MLRNDRHVSGELLRPSAMGDTSSVQSNLNLDGVIGKVDLLLALVLLLILVVDGGHEGSDQNVSSSYTRLT